MTDLSKRLSDIGNEILHMEMSFNRQTLIGQELIDLSAAYDAELSKSQWIPSSESPKSSGQYLCWMRDDRGDFDEEWPELVNYQWYECKDFKCKWITADFGQVVKWKEVEPPE